MAFALLMEPKDLEEAVQTDSSMAAAEVVVKHVEAAPLEAMVPSNHPTPKASSPPAYLAGE